MKNKLNIKNIIFNIKISEEENRIIHELRNNYNINTSSLIRNMLLGYYKKIKEKERYG